MIVKIAIVDDMCEESGKLKDLLSEYSNYKDIKFSIEVFQNAETFLNSFTSAKYDIIFMDIYMTGMTGIEAAEKISSSLETTLLIFLTQSSEHMPEAFHLHAYDYLLKPIDRTKLSKLLNDAVARLATSAPRPELTFYSDKNEYHLPFDMIMATKSERHYLYICSLSGETYKTRMTFSDISTQLLSDPRFLVILRGIIVNMDYIKEINEGSCLLEHDLRLPVHLKKSKEIEQTWYTYMFNKVKKETLERLKVHNS